MYSSLKFDWFELKSKWKDFMIKMYVAKKF